MTEPVTLLLAKEIVISLVADGFTAMIGHMYSKGRELFGQVDEIKKGLAQDSDFSTTVQKLQASVAKAIPSSEFSGNLKAFLVSPEVESVMRKIFAAQLASDSPENLHAIQEDFGLALRAYFNEKQIEEGKLSDLFRAFVQGTDRALGLAINKGFIPALDFKANIRHKIVLNELDGIKKSISLLSKGQSIDVDAIQDFEDRYRAQLVVRHGYLTPPHIDGAKKIPIDELYVPPAFIKPGDKKGESVRFGLSDLMPRLYRAILLGNPGGGKSSLSNKLCHDLAAPNFPKIYSGRKLTPLLVVLRDYGAQKKTEKCSIVQHIEDVANSSYQLAPPKGAIEYLLTNGRAMVIFDGLDELLDTRDRREISADVENFCSLYPSVPILVTSREVGYEQAPLAKDVFETFTLAPFDENQVSEYVTKWFQVDSDLPIDQRKQKATNFLKESEIVSELRSNPLMLALMCNIYRGENYIPRNRPDVYEKCSRMLFERWDKGRGINVQLPIEAHIDPAMKDLAFWIFSNPKLQSGVSEKNLISRAADYLCGRRFEDRDEAEAAARKFIEFCRGRAWVFTDTGTNSEGESLYQFTHRTFLEYFSAAHLVRTHPTPDKLAPILLSRIQKREWDIVAQLSVQLLNKNVEGGGDDLLLTLMNHARSEGKNGWNTLSFAIRCLEFTVPRPKLVRDLTTQAIELAIDWGLDHLDDGEFVPGPTEEVEKPSKLLADLLTTPGENRPVVTDCVEKVLVSTIKGKDQSRAILATQIGLHLRTLLRNSPNEVAREPQQYWSAVSSRIRETSAPEILAFAKTYKWLSALLLRDSKITIETFCESHGLAGLFDPTVLTLLGNTYWMSPVELITRDVAYGSNNLKTLKEQLLFIGNRLASNPPPWIESHNPDLGFFGAPRFEKVDLGLKAEQFSSTELFGFMALNAIAIEMTEKLTHSQLIGFLKRQKSELYQTMRGFLLARYERRPVTQHEVDELRQKFGFDEKQILIFRNWAARETNFLQSRLKVVNRASSKVGTRDIKK